MRLCHDTDETLVRWRTKAGHRDGDQWIADDGPGERTGPYGKIHISTPSRRITPCGQEIPDEAELVAEAGLARLCHNCLRILMGPYL